MNLNVSLSSGPLETSVISPHSSYSPIELKNQKNTTIFKTILNFFVNFLLFLVVFLHIFTAKEAVFYFEILLSCVFCCYFRTGKNLEGDKKEIKGIFGFNIILNLLYGVYFFYNRHVNNIKDNNNYYISDNVICIIIQGINIFYSALILIYVLIDKEEDKDIDGKHIELNRQK